MRCFASTCQIAAGDANEEGMHTLHFNNRAFSMRVVVS